MFRNKYKIIPSSYSIYGVVTQLYFSFDMFFFCVNDDECYAFMLVRRLFGYPLSFFYSYDKRNIFMNFY